MKANIGPPRLSLFCEKKSINLLEEKESKKKMLMNKIKVRNFKLYHRHFQSVVDVFLVVLEGFMASEWQVFLMVLEGFLIVNGKFF